MNVHYSVVGLRRTEVGDGAAGDERDVEIGEGDPDQRGPGEHHCAGC